MRPDPTDVPDYPVGTLAAWDRPDFPGNILRDHIGKVLVGPEWYRPEPRSMDDDPPGDWWMTVEFRIGNGTCRCIVRCEEFGRYQGAVTLPPVYREREPHVVNGRVIRKPDGSPLYRDEAESSGDGSPLF